MIRVGHKMSWVIPSLIGRNTYSKILRQRTIFNEAERRALLEEIQRDLADQLFLVYGAQPVSRDIYSGKVKNYRPGFSPSGFLHYVLYEGWLEA